LLGAKAVITCRRVLSALSALMGWRFRFHSVQVPRAWLAQWRSHRHVTSLAPKGLL